MGEKEDVHDVDLDEVFFSPHRCTDLIDEMAQMNAELKRRGERLAEAQEEVAGKVSLAYPTNVGITRGHTIGGDTSGS